MFFNLYLNPLQDATMAHLANVGPLAVAVDASNWSFYSGGVFDGCDFSDNIGLNHAVQMVGYGTDPAEGDYWIVRNSWGTRYKTFSNRHLLHQYFICILT